MVDQVNTGQITEAQTSQTGKSLILKINGEKYFTKLWDLLQKSGHTIEFEWSLSDYNGKQMKWINSYVSIKQNLPPLTTAGQLAQQNVPMQPPSPSPTAAPALPEIPCMPFISNTVNALIGAGLIKNKRDLLDWSNWSLLAYNGLGKGPLFEGYPNVTETPIQAGSVEASNPITDQVKAAYANMGESNQASQDKTNRDEDEFKDDKIPF